MKTLILVCLSLFLPFQTFASKDYSTRLCESGKFKCIRIEQGNTWSSLWPDRSDQKLIMHFNRTNKQLRPGMILALPPSGYFDVLSLAPFERKIIPPNEKLIVVNLKQLAWGAYTPDGTLINWGPASGGRKNCIDSKGICKTAIGFFEIYDVRGEKCVSSQYPINKGGAPMPYGMFFEKGYALHGTNELPGYNASHGCVRLFKNDAKWLNENFVQTPGKTKVLVLPY